MSEKVYQQGVVMETEHLILRDMEYSDSEAIFRNINNDREVLKYYLAPFQDKLSEDYLRETIDYCRRAERYCWAMVLKETGETIGMMNQCNRMDIYFQNMEIGYAIGRKYWNNGYTTEALVAAMDFLFNQGVHKVFCSCLIENGASRRVMEKSGMIYEGLRKEEVYYRDRYWDIETFYKLNPYQ